MPVRSHHTDVAEAPQSLALVEDAWSSEVVPQIPTELGVQARTLRGWNSAPRPRQVGEEDLLTVEVQQREAGAAASTCRS